MVFQAMNLLRSVGVISTGREAGRFRRTPSHEDFSSPSLHCRIGMVNDVCGQFVPRIDIRSPFSLQLICYLRDRSPWSASHSEIEIQDVNLNLFLESVLRQFGHLDHLHDCTRIPVAHLDHLV